ncbi:MAG: SDR family NAD(P)-dependent oxidoreductase [Fimbriimonadaceae bacterium]|nr:SDR family NAD(P)-dependent oxidoreductase [Fimbriimonadaceae bacterium]
MSDSSWAGKRVLVTGAAGFIGSHLSERLVQAGAKVRAMVHYNFQGSRGWLDHSSLAGEMDVYAGDITDRDSVKLAMEGCDAVFHLAALIAIPYSYRAPGSYVNANIIGTLNVLQAGRELETPRIAHTSTSEVYGTALYAPIDEKHPLQGQSPYSASKIGADKIAESFYLSFGTPVVTVRPFNTFGPRQSARAVIPTIISQCLSGRTVKLGSLTPTRDMNFVRNTAEGFMAAAASDKAIGETINFGSGREITIGDLAHMIADMAGAKIEIQSEEERLRPEKSEVNRLIASNAKALELTGWTPRTSLEEGLEETIAWFRDNLHLYRPDVYNV